MIRRIRRSVIDYLYTGNSVKLQRADLIRSLPGGDFPKTERLKSLFVDVSIITQDDAQTGIQRVVRAMLTELQKKPPPGYKIYPVFATRKQSYHHVPRDFSLTNSGLGASVGMIKPITAGPGDIFLGLDLTASILPTHHGQLESWKKRGTTIHFLIYDLLPVLNPEWFHSRTTQNFYHWLKTIAILADSAICISNSVKNELKCWLKIKYGIDEISLPIHTVPMGCDLDATLPSTGLPEQSNELLQKYAGAPTALMLGTLEPRKGHMLVINAFEELWKRGYNYQLAIIGKPGWKTQTLQSYINNHKELDQRLFWQKDASDQFIDQVFQRIFGLISASKGEGFGLPLIEAAAYGKPILARDIPVFRETNIVTSYFDDDNCQILSNHIHNWFHRDNSNASPGSQLHTWKSSTDVLKNLICQENKNIPDRCAVEARV